MKGTARLRILILLALALGALVSSLGALLWGNQDWGGLALNLGSELVGALVTYGLLELFIGGRERREAEEKELEAKKANLIAQLGSSVKDVAVAAAEELARQGWLTDGSLQGTVLRGANLEGAILVGTNLQGAWLVGANLEGANLLSANLVGANLGGANLHGALIKWTVFDENTILPDTTKWTPDTDMARFTDSDHPDFWRRGA